MLDRVVVPVLRQKGFTGQSPHFRRITAARIDLLSVFFDPHHHGFVFKFGRCGPEGPVARNGKRIAPDKATVDHLMLAQLAWISPDAQAKDAAFWFRFEPGNEQSMQEAARNAVPYLLQVDL